MDLSRLSIDGTKFLDEYGREVILRGVNLGGDSKVPYPKGGTQYPTDFSDHRDISFVGRPFPLQEADEHFSRLRDWGFNCLRLLTTWEAVEHKGSGQYDADYLEYYQKICEIAGEYGLYVFVDFHQDVWSRMTGGDGAPCWLFEKIGIDYRKLSEADAAIVMQHRYDYESKKRRQPKNYPTMCWGQNYKYAGNAIMWTLFFAGREFAPDFSIDGKNVQDYMQGHFLSSMRQIAKRVKDLPNVLGFDSLNEPNSGWIGIQLDDRRTEMRENDPAMPGIAWSPVEALYASHGHSITLPYLDVSILKLGMGTVSKENMNPDEVSIWLEDDMDPFLNAGAYRIGENGNFEVLNNLYFCNHNFNEEFMFPFISRVAENIHSVQPKWFVFAEKDAKDATFEPQFPDSKKLPENLHQNMVNATHWYDNALVGTKKIRRITLDLIEMKPVFGYKNIEKMYIRQMDRIKKASMNVPNKNSISGFGCPTLIGEFGIMMDVDNGKAYKKWRKGDHSSDIWKKHIIALDSMYNALDKLHLNGTLWNYTAGNRNDLRICDQWNQEDLSIYSKDQEDAEMGIRSGGRALEGCVRPFPHFVQGRIHHMEFDRNTSFYDLRFRADGDTKHPTEIYVPSIHFGSDVNRMQIEINGKPIHTVIESELENQILRFLIKRPGDYHLTIALLD